MKKLLFIFTLLLGTFGINAQSVISVVGWVFDENTSERIPNVKITSSRSHKVEISSNAKGEFSYSVKTGGIDTLFFHHVGFDSAFTVITEREKIKALKKGITLDIKIGLTYQEFNAVTVYAKKVDTIYGSEKHSVEDFLITEEGNLLLLAYEKTLKKGAKIVLTDAHQIDITEAAVPGDALYLYKDFEGTPYVICENKIFAIEIVNEQIRFETVSADDFYSFYHRVIDTIGTQYYYSTFNELYPAVSFVVTNRNDTTHQELIEIKDDFMMELYRAQFKYVSGRDKLWAYRKEQETGIDKEIWIGATSFTQDILYKPVYAPLFIIKDTVHIFDQYKKKLYKFNSFNEKVDSVELDFAQNFSKEKWEQPLIHDKVNDSVYGLYNKGGFYFIKSINCQDGKIEKELKLSNRFVERIKISGGKVYYIYRPYESLQKKFIYAEEIQ